MTCNKTRIAKLYDLALLPVEELVHRLQEEGRDEFVGYKPVIINMLITKQEPRFSKESKEIASEYLKVDWSENANILLN